MKEISLRPYNGRLFIASSKEEYEKQHIRLFKTPDVITCSAGRFSGGEGKDGLWTYLVYADAPNTLAHEICHVVFHVFQRCDIDPTQAREEPFCYMVGQLMLEAL